MYVYVGELVCAELCHVQTLGVYVYVCSWICNVVYVHVFVRALVLHKR
jgi:hypothetical protein